MNRETRLFVWAIALLVTCSYASVINFHILSSQEWQAAGVDWVRFFFTVWGALSGYFMIQKSLKDG